MNFNRLKYFIMVADEQNITKASKKLYIAQPSLSQCIRSIELEVGATLFNRGRSSLSLTKAGELYYRWAKSTLDSYERMENDIAEICSGARSQLNVGATWQRSMFLLTDAVADFYKINPSCNIKIKENLDVNLHDMLEKGVLDLLIGSPSKNSSDYYSDLLIKERFFVAAGSKFKLKLGANPYTIDKSQLVGLPIVWLQERQDLGKRFRKLLSEINYSPKDVIECRNLETAHKFVKNNIGVSLLPEISIACGKYPEVNYYLLSGEQYYRKISAVYKKGHPLEREITALISCIKQFIAKADYPFITSF